jgi:hypothetical protein
MLLVTSNKSKQLLYLTYIGHVQVGEFEQRREEFTTQLGEMSPGFRLLADFSQLEAMDLDCAAELGRIMELIGKAGAGLVVRVISDPRKDIGMNILTAFHYPHRARIATCNSMAEAVEALGL